jgi:hypothetical protein
MHHLFEPVARTAAKRGVESRIDVFVGVPHVGLLVQGCRIS